MRTRWSLALLIPLLLAPAGCGERALVDAGPPGGDDGYEVTEVDLDFEDPPPVVLHLPDGSTHDLAPWSYCLDGGCADGAWPANPVDVGSPEWVDVTFGSPGWDFEATFHEPRTRTDEVHGRSVAATVEPRGEHTFRVRPAGRAGPWHVDLFGRGEGGDVIVTFVWTTTADGDFPDAGSGEVSVLVEDDGTLSSYGVELGLSDLARTPREATASIEVIAEDGRSATLDLGPPVRTWEEGRVAWDAGPRLAAPAVALGGESFEYRVTVRLDGERYVGTATWPEDTNPEIVPAVPLDFEPALPGYDAARS